MSKVIIKNLGEQPYVTTWQAMQEFTNLRDSTTVDQLWILEHPPVFTQGQAGKPEHLLNQNHKIPVVQSDRGGQITYHGPGQIIIYLLIDLKRLKLSIRQLVTTIETAVINTLNENKILAYADKDAPGIYTDINNKKYKICSLGLRVRRGCTYHGLALNYKMDLTPFNFINPCGYNNLAVTQITDLNNHVSKNKIITSLCAELTKLLGYNQIIEDN